MAKQDEKLHRSSLEHFCKRLGTCSDGIGIWDFALITLIYRGDPFVFRLQGGGEGGGGWEDVSKEICGIVRLPV